MKKILIPISIVATIISACNSFQQQTESQIPQADLVVTVDCPKSNNSANVFLSGEAISGIQNTKAIQISKIETDLLSGRTLNVKAYIHPIDENNNFIDDFDNPKLFCEIIDSSNFKKMLIKDFTVTKITTKDKIPNYFAFVLDHSGSMGEERAKVLQKAVLKFAENQMADEDRLMVVKFDVANKAIIFPRKDSPEFENFAQDFVSGLSGFGSATSLYDAVETGMSELDFNAGSEFSKSLIILTDGYENSSKVVSSGEDLVQLAKQSKTNIHTIGFAENIDKLLLADTLSMQTGGIFQQICSSSELNLVFSDIYSRTKSYYVIEYNTINYPGIHTLKLKTCDKNIKKNLRAENVYLLPNKDKEAPIPLDVYFEFAKFNLKMPESKAALDIMDTLLRNDPMMRIEIQGHTDSIGTDKANQALSDNRAKAVMNAMIVNGIDKSRVTAVGYGESKPIAENSSDEGRAANRRVVFVIKQSSSTVKRTTPFYKSPIATSR